MGVLKDKFRMTLIGRTPKGTCPICAVTHAPEQPHNCHSLAYQYKFFDANGRFPTWEDAMDHCAPEVKAIWRKELGARGALLGGGTL